MNDETNPMMNEAFTPRMQRGSQILANGTIPRAIVENVNDAAWEVPSQTTKGTIYKVTRKYNNWRCDCPDHEKRHVNCKHIHAVRFWLKLKKKIYETEPPGMIPNGERPMVLTGDTYPQEEAFFCKTCGSDNIIKHGNRKTKHGPKTRYKCKSCGHTFVAIEEGFQNMVFDPEIVTLALDLYFKGTSLRKIEDHLRQFHDMTIGHTTVYNWVKKYSEIINDYVKSLDPQVSGVWSADEMMIRAQGKNAWLWSVMDQNTRYMLSNLITHKRHTGDATKLFEGARDQAKGKPKVMLTDGLYAYRGGFNKVFYTHHQKSKHVVSPGIRDPVNNNKMERVQGTIRERSKVMRGMQNNATAEDLIVGFKAYYNFVRPHMSLDGKTPAEAANLDLGLGKNRWKGLIDKAVEHCEKSGAQ